MSLNLRQVHVYKKVPGKSQFALTEINPAITFSQGEEHVVLQHGEFYSPGGQRFKKAELPGWMEDALNKANPEALREAGLIRDPKAAKAAN